MLRSGIRDAFQKREQADENLYMRKKEMEKYGPEQLRLYLLLVPSLMLVPLAGSLR